MSDAVDLASLREITGGDADIERELFQVFVESSEENIAALKLSADEGKSDEWRKQAHAMKGTSLSLGAAELGYLCKQAQDQYQAPNEIKLAMLAAIESEFSRVKTFLQNASMPR